MAISFEVHTEPLPKARPRFSGGHAYTPKRTQDYEELVKQYALIASREGSYFNAEPLAVTIHFRRKDNRKADLDNLCKAVLDACNKILWQDDKQIHRLVLSVEYKSKNPGFKMDVIAY